MLLCVLYLPLKKKNPSTQETSFNIIRFKLTVLSHRACFCTEILQNVQNVSLRAAAQAPYLSFYIGIVNMVYSQSDCDNSLSALHWQSFIHKSPSWTKVLQVKQLLLLFPHRSQVCTQEEREGWSRALGTCSSATSIDNTKYAQRFSPQLLFFPSFLPLSF